MVEELIPTVAERVLGSVKVTVRGHEVDLTPPWPRKTLREAILERTGVDYARHPTLEALAGAVREAGLRVEPQPTRAQLIDKLLDHVAAVVVQPVFFTDYPIELSPLAKLKPGSTDTVERFEAFAAGIELGNAFTELNDPDEQYRRFQEQVRQGEAGDADAHVMDLDFIAAMQQGMPPAGGLGIGHRPPADVPPGHPHHPGGDRLPHAARERRLKADTMAPAPGAGAARRAPAGGMAEWLKASVLKTEDRKVRGIESLSLRLPWFAILSSGGRPPEGSHSRPSAAVC